VTLLDRAASRLRLREVEPLTVRHEAVVGAAEFLGMT
jgi:hypothetical protein